MFSTTPLLPETVPLIGGKTLLTEMTEENEEVTFPSKVSFLLSDDGISAPIEAATMELQARGYGEPNARGFLVLSPVETLYLLEPGKIEVTDGSGEQYSFNRLLSKFIQADENVWRDYVVYRDLRKRRYVVKEGFGSEMRFRVFERGQYGKSAAKYIIIPLYEGRDTTVEKLTEIVRACRAMDKEPVLAVIDRRNEIVYYNASIADLRNL